MEEYSYKSLIDVTKKNNIFTVGISIVILGAVCISFYKYLVLKDYQITAQISCNPKTEDCFVDFCDIAEDPTCPADTQEATSYYKVIQKKASRMPSCDPASDLCVVDCRNDNMCNVILCSNETQEFGDTCAGPGIGDVTDGQPKTNKLDD